MTRDCRGLEVSGGSDRALEAINHFALALVSQSGESAAVIAAAQLERFAREQTGNAARIWRKIGLAQVQASLAFAQGDWARSAQLFESVLPEIACGGGSDEQRGVFSQSYLLSLIGLREPRAGALLRQWIGSRTPLPLEQRWLSKV